MKLRLNSPIFALIWLVFASESSIRTSEGIVCTPNICNAVKCVSIEQATINCEALGPNHRFNPKGGFCGCCPSCVRIIPLGGDCSSMLIKGVPANAECEDGLKCDPTTHKCC